MVVPKWFPNESAIGENMLRAIDPWLSDEEQANIYSASFWNDIEQEKKKEWWIADGNYQRCMAYLERSGLLHEYCEAEKVVAAFPGDSLKIADLAAGIGWTSALLSKLPNVSEVHAVEISRHRLGDLCEHSVRMMHGNEDKLYRHLGSFYDLQFDNDSLDLLFLSQGFHHANRPLSLLVECDRVLKEGGKILLIGEPNMGVKTIIRRIMKLLIKERRLVTAFSELFPPDHETGDHYYSASNYRFMFGIMGYELRYQVMRTGNAMLVATKAKNLSAKG